jgi:hypothetical protein
MFTVYSKLCTLYVDFLNEKRPWRAKNATPCKGFIDFWPSATPHEGWVRRMSSHSERLISGHQVAHPQRHSRSGWMNNSLAADGKERGNGYDVVVQPEREVVPETRAVSQA